MKVFTLLRVSKSDEATVGMLIYNKTGIPSIVTLEEPWRGNAAEISCIPTGTYEFFLSTNKVGRSVFKLSDVPGRKGIQVHIGNDLSDTTGCILVGKELGHSDIGPTIHKSTQAFAELKSMCGVDRCKLVIKEAIW